MAATKSTILLVEDEAFYVDFYGRALKGAGFKVTSALNGEEALTWIKKHGQPDVIVADLIMPYLGGMKFLDAIKGQAKHIIVLTALGGETDRQDAMNRGAEVFCQKTETPPAELVRIVRACLTKGSKSRGAKSRAKKH